VSRLWSYTTAGLLQPLDGSVPIDPPDPDPVGGKLRWVGLSRSIAGLNASASSKQAATLERTDQFATAAGVTGAAIRAKCFYHFYHTGVVPDWNINGSGFSGVSFARTNGFMGVSVNMKLSLADKSGLAIWANGGHDTNFRSYLASMQALSPLKFMVVIEHEPENNGWVDADNANWRMGTARFMKIVYELNDPNIYFSTCHVPGAKGQSRALWNPRPDLNTLMGSSAAAKPVMDRSFCGPDPYPEVNGDMSLDTLNSRLAAAMTDYRSFGFTRFYMPEVAFFNYVGTSGPVGPLNGAGQAQRLYDQFGWALANGFEGWNYFDVTASGNTRSNQRILETPEEQLAYARIILGLAP
jgi:hypothetical protein